MLVTILTKSSGFLSPIYTVLGLIMNGIYEFFHLFGIQNIALTIIMFTFFVRALMLPLTIKQQKFAKLSSKMTPEIQKIQAKYKGKKDEASLRKQQEETQIIYQKYGANPTSGCLPVLITLPILFALYYVITNIPAYVGHVYNLYEGIAEQVKNTANYQNTLTTVAGNIKNYKVPSDLSSINSIIDVLKKFNTNTWNVFTTNFSDIQNNVISGKVTVANTINSIKNVNNFFGLNISDNPGIAFPAVLIPILAGLLQFVQGKQIQVKTKDSNQDNPTAAAMNSMNVVMPFMSAIICISMPIGVGIYWIAGSVFAIIQQFFVNKYMDRVDVDELIAKNVAKQSKRNAYLESKGISMADLAKKQTKNIESSISEKSNSINVNEKQSNEDEKVEDSNVTTKSSTNGKSITEIANLLRNKNEKGDK